MFNPASSDTLLKMARQCGSENMDEQFYLTFFEDTDEGFCVFEMLYDDHGQPADYRFIGTNPAFEKQSGMTAVTGKTVRQLIPGIEYYWLEIYHWVASTGLPVRFEDHGTSLNRWFNVYAFRVGKPEERRVATLFTDITARKLAETNL